METIIYFLLHSLGIGAKYRGFRYLAYGINYLAIRTKIISFGSDKTLHPKIAANVSGIVLLPRTRHLHRIISV